MEEKEGIPTLILKTALFDHKSAYKLSTQITPQQLWTLKLSLITFYTQFALRSIERFVPALDQFYLENMHRQPTTKPGYFQYYKHRNYFVIRQVLGPGIRYGLQMSTATIGYCMFEELYMKLGLKNSVLECTFAGFSAGAVGAWLLKLRGRSLRIGLASGAITGMCIGAVQELFKRTYAVSIKEYW